jgi:ADP-ribosylglycohydrolase
MPLPHDYTERVYAGVLGKIIGVYLGRPFEGWTYERIMDQLGEITHYVNDQLPWAPPLIVTDDDITGTFTFLRALPDYGNSPDLTPAQIGQTWLNYIIEDRTILWWGGLGNSSEHTAYLRLKEGTPAPESGSIALNGAITAEQIGAQIFIDGWAMVAPGDPEMAADLARRAASVSHDGEAIYASQVLAAMESLAFVEADIEKLIDCGVSLIPKDSEIYRMIADVRDWHEGEADWHKTRAKIAQYYGYDKYGGNVHVVPNHALIILGLLYSNDDFREAMKVVNTAGWDTDCNSGNLGCLMGIKNGLKGLDLVPDLREPVADRLYLPTADGGRSITDAVRETYHVVNAGRRLASKSTLAPKNGSRFHFELPGSVQGFRPLEDGVVGNAVIENVPGHSQLGKRSLAIGYQGGYAMVATPCFILPEELDMEGYELVASPSLYSGQIARAGLSTEREIRVRPFIRHYNLEDSLDTIYGPETTLEPGGYTEITWRIPDTGSQPIADIGLDCAGVGENSKGTVYLDYLTWDGEPDVVLTRPASGNKPWEPPLVWRRAWANGMDMWEVWWPESYRLCQNSGRGLIIQGTRQWHDYQVSAQVTSTLMSAGGVAARVRGMRRYYALLLCRGGVARLVKVRDDETTLAECEFAWEVEKPYEMRLVVNGAHLRGWVGNQLLFDLNDEHAPLLSGGIALVCEEGTLKVDRVEVKPHFDGKI